jgi:hypothetical protein
MDDEKKKKKPRRRRSSQRSDDDEDEPTSPTSPLAPFPPPPPASSRSRAPEFYGFVAWAVTYLLFVLYFLWAILPDGWIVWLGVSWYPNRCVVHSRSRALSFPGERMHACWIWTLPGQVSNFFPPSIENGHCSSRHGRSWLFCSPTLHIFRWLLEVRRPFLISVRTRVSSHFVRCLPFF